MKEDSTKEMTGWGHHPVGPTKQAEAPPGFEGKGSIATKSVKVEVKSSLSSKESVTENGQEHNKVDGSVRQDILVHKTPACPKERRRNSMGVKRYKVGKHWWFMAYGYTRDTRGNQRRFKKKKIPTREMAESFYYKMKSAEFAEAYFNRNRTADLTVRQAWENVFPIIKRDKVAWQSDKGRAKHLLNFMGDRKVRTLTLKDIESYRTMRLDEKTKRGRSPSNTTLNHEVGLLKRMINYSIRCGDLDVNPVANVKKLKENNTRDVIVTDEEFDRLYECANADIRPILLVAYDTGMRLGEILKLKWSHVSLKDKRFRLRQEDTKTDRPRIIILSRRVVKALKSLPRGIKRDSYVFVNADTGTRWVDIRKQYNKAKKKAGLEHVWFHDLRRSFVTNARKRGVPESVIMRMSGHRTREVFDRYNIVCEDDIREAIERIECARDKELKSAKKR